MSLIKKRVWLLVGVAILLILGTLILTKRPPSLAAGTPLVMSDKSIPKVKAHALVMTYPFDEALELSEVVSEISIVKNVGEIYEPTAKTIFSAVVTKTFKGSVAPGDAIQILQEGNGKVEFNDTPLFQPGEKYVLILKKATDFPEGTYWILGGETGIYQVIDDNSIVKWSKSEKQLQNIEIEGDIETTKLNGILELAKTKETQLLSKEKFEKLIKYQLKE